MTQSDGRYTPWPEPEDNGPESPRSQAGRRGARSARRAGGPEQRFLRGRGLRRALSPGGATASPSGAAEPVLPPGFLASDVQGAGQAASRGEVASPSLSEPPSPQAGAANGGRPRRDFFSAKPSCRDSLRSLHRAGSWGS